MTLAFYLDVLYAQTLKLGRIVVLGGHCEVDYCSKPSGVLVSNMLKHITRFPLVWTRYLLTTPPSIRGLQHFPNEKLCLNNNLNLVQKAVCFLDSPMRAAITKPLKVTSLNDLY